MTSQLLARKSTVETKIIYGREVHPEVGSVVELDARDGCGERLREGDDYKVEGYDGCDFRFPINFGPIKDVACNVKVTGRTLKNRGGSHWTRCQVEFVGDCEPSTFAGGWLCTATATLLIRTG